jgi:catechol-2,3-dioxygenase
LGSKLPDETQIGQVRLAVADLDRSVHFYEDRLGFKIHRRDKEMALLGAGEGDLLALVHQPGARRVRGTTGLYHFAI